MTDDGAFIAEASAAAGRETSVLLRAVSHPEFGDILIDATPFAVGRNELPFASYDKDVVAALSRRHARIFWEGGELYVADLGSKNGTKVNGAAVAESARRLHERDELRFGDLLTYRVKLLPRARTARKAGTLLSLTLTPERDDLLLEPIVITRFPFLVGKIDDVFARYKDAYPHQVTYVSRRHAHIFLKDDVPFVEDLGSTNGTFVGGTRLDERAVELHDGDVLAFGGSHFVYKVALQREVETEPTLTRFRPPAPAADAGNADKTTFVAAPDSFLDIFCLAPPPADEAPAESAAKGDDAARPAPQRQRRATVFAREFGRAFAGDDRRAGRRALKWGVPVLALVAAAAVGLRFAGNDERELEALVADGDYARAATVADAQLASDPDDAGAKTIGADAILKAKLPEWIGDIEDGKFDVAAALLADMKARVPHNAEAQALLGELDWVADIERFVAERGGPDAPIDIY
ncbi:FHA domain-containing protein, partial [Aromatoleum sp.]|uniref:FHA domain-containing protein n=1 Tax=Aromatoleum sp. TaxID=2307007 RepID=UPI002FC9CD0F